MPEEEAKRGAVKGKQVNFYEETLDISTKLKQAYKNKKQLIRAEEMPWENCRQGLIKHVVNEKMDTAEQAMNIYIQTIPGGSRSGKRKQLAEEIFFVLEGKGYDLHWDPRFGLKEEYSWNWAEEPKWIEWKEGDLVYIPPYVINQHFNADPSKQARFIAATNRVVEFLGFTWLEQLEDSPDYKK